MSTPALSAGIELSLSAFMAHSNPPSFFHPLPPISNPPLQFLSPSSLLLSSCLELFQFGQVFEKEGRRPDCALCCFSPRIVFFVFFPRLFPPLFGSLSLFARGSAQTKSALSPRRTDPQLASERPIPANSGLLKLITTPQMERKVYNLTVQGCPDFSFKFDEYFVVNLWPGSAFKMDLSFHLSILSNPIHSFLRVDYALALASTVCLSLRSFRPSSPPFPDALSLSLLSFSPSKVSSSGSPNGGGGRSRQEQVLGTAVSDGNSAQFACIVQNNARVQLGVKVVQKGPGSIS